MSIRTQTTSGDYAISVEELAAPVSVYHDHQLLAQTDAARIMYETRLSPVIYVPKNALKVELIENPQLKTFCPFKGTASYGHLKLGPAVIENACWYYKNALPEARSIENHIAFSAHDAVNLDLGENQLRPSVTSHIAGPTVDWILREAWTFKTPQELTKAIAHKLLEDGIVVSRMSVMIWSLHPMIAGKNYIWTRSDDNVAEYTPSYDIHQSPAFVNSPLKHVSNGLGGVRQRLLDDEAEFSFPIMDELRAQGATDYVAMPLPFSGGQTNVLTLTCDHPEGFTTANLGLLFEISSVISRYYEVFTQRENSRTLLETYLGKRTGQRVLGGEIRRGDGDEIDAAILFCDLRGSTALEESLERTGYLELLNAFFEGVTDIVNEYEGEVLKFMGDAVLASFPVQGQAEEARRQALEAANRIAENFDQPTRQNPDFPISCAIGLAYGPVTYGNVGSRERLDFTVIGRAANLSARLSDFAKENGMSVVMTKDFAEGHAACLPLGEIELHNIAGPQLCFALPPSVT